MSMVRVNARRRGALSLEAAVVLPVMIVLLIGLIVGGMGVFRYQQVAALAREAARWTSTRGRDWQRETRLTCPTETQIREKAVLPLSAGMDRSKLAVTVQWINPVKATTVAWDASKKSPKSLDANNRYVSNLVRVTVTYDWVPGVIVTGTVQLKSVCEIPMSF